MHDYSKLTRKYKTMDDRNSKVRQNVRCIFRNPAESILNNEERHKANTTCYFMTTKNSFKLDMSVGCQIQTYICTDLSFNQKLWACFYYFFPHHAKKDMWSNLALFQIFL